MLGADIGMAESLGFLAGQRQNFFYPRRVRNVADDFCFRPGADLLLDLHPHGLQVEPHFLQDVDSHALSKLDQPEKQMLGSDVVVIEAVCFLAGKLQDLLSAGRKIIHYSLASQSSRSPTPSPVYQYQV